MTNQIKNTPIRPISYASKGMIGDLLQASLGCVIQPDGTLWAAFAMGTAFAQLIRSEDNGFSWELVDRGATTAVDLRTPDSTIFDGPLVNLVIDEVWRNLDIYLAYYDAPDYLISRSRYDLDNIGDGYVETDIINPGAPDVEVGAYNVDYNNNEAYVVYASTTDTIKTLKASPRSLSRSAAVSHSDTFINGIHGIKATSDGLCHIIYSAVIGGDTIIKYTRYIETSNNFLAAVTIKNLGAVTEFANPSVSIDGNGTLLAMWDETTATSANQFYSLSLDVGANWDTPIEVPVTAGQTDFFDPVVTARFTSNLDTMGGQDGGYVMCYTRFNADSFGRVFVRRLTTTDGATYTLEDEAEIGTVNYPARHIVGGKFFKPTGSSLIDLRDPGLVRIAFSVGTGDDASGLDDTKNVVFAQELLSEAAYTDLLPSDTATFSIDTAGSDDLLVGFTSVGSPADNVDFYALGMIGKHTEKYLKAFDKLGTAVRFLNYEPDLDNKMNERSAYGAPVESSELVLVDPISYSFPVPQLETQSSYAFYIEQDVRKIYMPPDRFLARTFVINAGGFLKRTVWLIEYDGNQYELSQIVPRFINNEICYYEANLYVVGPSRDPFSRTILPSET